MLTNLDTTTDGTAVTGTTANTLTSSITIPANTVAVGDIINIRVRARKTGTAGTITMRWYVNTSAAIGGSTVGTSTTPAAANIYIQMSRTLAVKSSTVTEAFQGGGATLVDDVAFTALPTNNNIDWTVQQFFVVALQNGAAGDSSVSSFISIQIYK